MSEDQLSSLLATLKVDAEFREKLQGAVDLDSALELANEAGFDVNRDDWSHVLSCGKPLPLSDVELEQIAGGKNTDQAACSHGAGPYCADSKTCPPERGGGCEW